MARRKIHAITKYTDLPEEVPECFTLNEWEVWFTLFNNQYGHLKRSYPDVYATACDECTLDFQITEIMGGRCLPRNPDATPIAKRLNAETNQAALSALPDGTDSDRIEGETSLLV